MDMDTQKIHVCFVCPKAYPLFNPAVESVFGGAEVDTYLIATELAKDERYAVSFIVADYGQPDEEIREQVRLLKSLDFRQNPLRGALKIRKALKKADADWYMLESASPGVLLVLLFTRIHHRKLLYRTASQTECDGLYLNDHPLLGRAFLYSLRKANQVVVQNQQDRENLKRRFKIDSSIIANGHRIPEIPGQNKQTILWVGRSAAVKGPQRFVELAEMLPDEKFVMICQRATDDTDYDMLKSRASDVRNLEFIERVPFQAIDRYFEAAKVFVNTSDSEGFPNTFVQACKAAAAILSYGINPDRFIDTYGCGMTCDFNLQRTAEHLRTLLEDDRYRVMGQKGRDHVAAHHDIARITAHYKTLFTKDEP